MKKDYRLYIDDMRALKKYGNRTKCHAELVSASDKINKPRDPEINSG